MATGNITTGTILAYVARAALNPHNWYDATLVACTYIPKKYIAAGLTVIGTGIALRTRRPETLDILHNLISVPLPVRVPLPD